MDLESTFTTTMRSEIMKYMIVPVTKTPEIKEIQSPYMQFSILLSSTVAVFLQLSKHK